jgi:hypothetical protein
MNWKAGAPACPLAVSPQAKLASGEVGDTFRRAARYQPGSVVSAQPSKVGSLCASALYAFSSVRSYRNGVTTMRPARIAL